MSTIDTVADDRESATVPTAADASGSHDSDAPASATRSAHRSAAAERRSLLVPVLSTAVGVLIAGVLGLAVQGFNTLRDDIRALDDKIDAQVGGLRSEMNQGFAQVNARFSQMDERFAQIDARFTQMDERFARVDERFDQVNATLFEHTDRLARIETIHSTHVHARPQP